MTLVATSVANTARTRMAVAPVPTGATPAADAPTSHAELLAWVTDIAALTRPDAVVWVDGSDTQRREPQQRSSAALAGSTGSASSHA